MTALEEIKKALEGVTPGPWKAVSEPHFDSGLVYTSVQPVNVDEEAMKPLAMANGEYHICRMSHTAAFWRFDYHRKNARYIAAVNPAAISELLSTLESLQRENEDLREKAVLHSADAKTAWAECDELRNLVERLKLEAQTHAMEARGANSTINEIYQIISGGKGEPGNWHGAEPVRKYVEELRADVKRLREALKPFAEYMGDHFDKDNHGNPLPDEQGAGWVYLVNRDFRRATAALASTGGEHHAE